MSRVPGGVRVIVYRGRIPLRVARAIVSRHAERREASPFGDETLRCAQGDTLRSEGHPVGIFATPNGMQSDASRDPASAWRKGLGELYF